MTVTPVKLGPAQGEVAVIDERRRARRRVVVDGADSLREGAKVEVVDARTRKRSRRAKQAGRGRPRGKRQRGKRPPVRSGRRRGAQGAAELRLAP